MSLYYCHRPPAPHETVVTIIGAGEEREHPSFGLVMTAWLMGAIRFDLTHETWPG